MKESEQCHQEFYGSEIIDGKRFNGEIWKVSNEVVFIFGLDGEEKTLRISGRDMQEIKELLKNGGRFISLCGL